MIRRVIGAGVVGGAISAIALHANDYKIDAIAAVRIARAATTVLDIAYCYRTHLYALRLDPKSDEYRSVRDSVHKECAVKLLDLCKANKGVYIKVGQHVGALDYLLPPEYVDTLKVLHKDAPANTVDQLYNTIKEELGQDPKDIFTDFDPVPLGTASLAQVHKAKLKKDGSVVAVKVQHSFVKKNTRADLRSMEILVNIMSRLFPDFTIQWLVNETKINIFRELNFLEEGHNSEKVTDMFKHYSWLKVPKVFWEFSTERLLVMEFVEGGQVNDLSYVKRHNIDPYDLCKKLGDLYSHMIFEKGFVHSDPHPGNILIKKDPTDKDVTVYLLDHGLYAYLTDDFRYNYAQFWLSIIDRNHVKMKKYAENLGIKDNMYAALACIITGRTWNAILKGIDRNKPNVIERDTVRNQLPNVIDQIALCLQNIDRQALLILKTNDLIRSIEFSLKTSDLMCGFRVMAKCCILSSYAQHMKETKNSMEYAFMNLKKFWTMFKFYVTFTYFDMRAKLFNTFNLGINH